MRTRLALFVAAAAAIAAIVMITRHRGAASKTPAASPTPAQARTPAPARSRTIRTGAVSSAEDVPEVPTAEGIPAELHAAYLAVEHAAKDCYRGRPAALPVRANGPDETIEGLTLAYDITVSGGIGHVEHLRVLDGALTDVDLQACILESVAIAQWEQLSEDGVLGSMEQNVRLGDLLRLDPGPPPEDERSAMPTAPPPPEYARPLGE